MPTDSRRNRIDLQCTDACTPTIRSREYFRTRIKWENSVYMRPCDNKDWNLITFIANNYREKNLVINS